MPLLHRAVLENIEHLRPFMAWISAEPLPIEDRYALVQRWATLIEQGTDWPCGIFVDGSVAGSSGLHQRRGPKTLEIGYWVHKDFTGRGLATLAARLLTGLAFVTPETEAVEIWHDRANQKSAGVARRLGYELVGEQAAEPGAETAPGEEGVDWIWRMTRTSWSEESRLP